MADTIPLYLDEDAQRTTILRALRARGIGVSDATQLAFAVDQYRTIFTFNRGDFVQLHTEYIRQHRTHAGIIVSDQLETGLIIRRLLKLLHARSATDMHNWLEFLSNWR